MTARRKWLMVALLMAVVLGALMPYFARSPSRSQMSAAGGRVAETATGEQGARDGSVTPAAFSGQAPAAPAQPPDPRLFDHDLPLAQRIADLDRYARRGDPAAACQAGFELLRCDLANERADYYENLASQQQQAARLQAATERRDRNRAILAGCAGVEPREFLAPVRYFQVAAQAGHEAAMLQVLSPRHYAPDALFRDPGLIGLLRSQAPRYFETLLARGNLDLLDRWSVAPFETGDALLQALPPPYNRAELATAVRRHLSEQMARAAGTPVAASDTPPQLRAEAAEFYRRHFAPHEAGQLAQRRARVAAPVKYGDLAHYDCQRVGR